MKIRVLIFTGYGINADNELEWAFQAVGASPERLHVSEILEKPEILKNYQILAFPGGFSYGDHLGSGRVFAQLLERQLSQPLADFIQKGLIIGICNGFQVLVKLGILPMTDKILKPEASLVPNSGGRFIDKWVQVKVQKDNGSPWLKGLSVLDLPIRHGEGRFIAHPETLSRMQQNSQIAFVYSDNPNGSMLDIAGITDPSGRVFGLMPHPEAFIERTQHPLRRRIPPSMPTGLTLFQNSVDEFK